MRRGQPTARPRATSRNAREPYYRLLQFHLLTSMVPDVFTTAKRSEVMSLVRAHGNKTTEIALAKLFRRNGITGWRRRQAVFGKPDFVFPKRRLAVFVDGCFWHCCPKHASTPKGNRIFWKRKLSANRRRDRIVNRTLRRNGWQVLRIWECSLKSVGSRRRGKKRIGDLQLEGERKGRPHRKNPRQMTVAIVKVLTRLKNA